MISSENLELENGCPGKLHLEHGYSKDERPYN